MREFCLWYKIFIKLIFKWLLLSKIDSSVYFLVKNSFYK